MKISGSICLLIAICTATPLLAQSSDSFVPIFESKGKTSADSVDGKAIVAEVEFVGFDQENSNELIESPVYKSDFLLSLREQQISFAENETFSGYKAHLVAKKLKEWFSEHGYAFANVAALGRRLPDNRMRLRFSVERGLFVATSEIRFVGNDNFSSSELVESFKSCAGENWKRYEKRLYEYSAQKCSRALMFSRGFWQAKIIDITSDVRGSVRTVQISIAEGPRYRFGKIEIEGNHVLSKKEILEMLREQPGDVADGKALQELVYEKLKEKYGDLGYVQYNAEFEPEFAEPRGRSRDGVVNVTITIDEGRQFKIGRIKFAGVDDEEGESLLGEFLLKAGDLMSPRKLQAAIDKFNELERFETVDAHRDIDMHTDEEGGGSVDLVITLKKRGR